MYKKKERFKSFLIRRILDQHNLPNDLEFTIFGSIFGMKHAIRIFEMDKYRVAVKIKNAINSYCLLKGQLLSCISGFSFFIINNNDMMQILNEINYNDDIPKKPSKIPKYGMTTLVYQVGIPRRNNFALRTRNPFLYVVQTKQIKELNELKNYAAAVDKKDNISEKENKKKGKI